ncbi:MAG: hypothetical protein A3D44_04185 [Candidatus Staskawiczbacteria bacterium RIFCSPHIGHO2_02_FULL_42_22]|uniref:FAD/NAD(P)-binding domain-containing protein n=1 Tax=Candidatus Staskawiczbacteria bacterium RIFCSPHIGHO2_02_FULL_42_22 TaxID=1802207 RepID=A0A1G2I4W8_9BACT|nr:MAG: hypothetical protein A3D44_04185 [Candidatus Staskawiczbacteria bacterium RIFCSPHIGHO2_02_FULL_42_22]
MVYDLIIIGAGPAGVSAAIYAARQKLNLLIISKDVGGQVAKKAVDIENYPGFEKISGPDLVALYQKQLKANGLEVTLAEVVFVEKSERIFSIKTASGKLYQALSVILTSGAESKTLGIPGEEEFAGKGVSYCSLCDGPVFRNKIVAVVGGGNNGFESALFLSNYVTHVYILEYSDAANADAENQELVERHQNIEIITSAKVSKIEGKVFVNAVYYEDRKSGQEKKLDVSGVFVEIGYSPATSFLGDLVELNEKKEVIFNSETLETKTPGLFSAGDCNVSRYKQIVMASGEGAKAALSAYNYIKRQK